ncbi:hypothetical protein KAR91_87080, partial [Candidatus Pacearchaeota archaeon]|nr:hypothetical protein [Candidatus Pacearchaeota archaeon]
TPEGKEHIETILNDMKEKASVEMPVEGKPEISAPTIEELFEKLKTEDLTEEELGGLLDQFAGGREIIEEVQAEPVAEIKERLLATGMDEAEATANAALFDGFRVLAQRAGVSVEDVMERYLPEVAREGVEEVAVPVVTEEERRAITDNPFLSDQITTEEQLTDVESLRAARERINETLVEQREEQTVSDEEMLQLGEAVSFLDEKIAAPSPEALAQPLQEGVTPEAPRGRIRIFPDSVGIELLKDADMSTFGHETGHLYLRMMQDLSSLETASEDLKADFETLKTWLNYEEGQIGYTEDQQEQFARGFEAYLREGKAPSSALAEAFENFKQWLMQIYKSLRDLNVKLTDEVRGVMDRMLADEGIEREEIVPAEEVLEQKAIPLPVDEQEFWRLAANSKEWSELNIDEMDRAAFGFSEEDITTLEPDQLNIKWQQDYDNVIEEQKDSGLSREEYARRIDLTEPIEVIYEDRQFKVDDGYHRWFAARVLNKTLNVTLEIKAKPHRTIIENAIINGKEVTNEVLAPYPDLIEARNKDELADYVKRLLAEPVEIPKPEVFEQAPKITNIRQLAKSLGGIDYNREHLKGELDKLKEDAPATKLIINKRGQGITLDRLRESAIEIGILTEEATLDDVLSALEVNLETAGAIEEDIVKDERIRSKIETREYEAAELKEEFIKVSQRARKAFREGRAAGVEKEAQKLKNILARARKLRIVRDYLNLTDADMKKLTTKNPLLMDQWEFKKFIDDLRVRAVELSETKLQKAMLIHMIHSKDLSNVDNYRKVLGLPAITKMTTGQAREFALALEPFEDGSSFLTVRQLQLIDRTELEGARTYEEAKAILSEKTGMSIEDLSKISITEWTKFKWDTSLAESDPFLNLLVRGVNEKLLEANIRAFDIETKVHDLAKKSEKSRPRTFIEKIIPQDKLIFQYLEAPADEKADVMANMTKEQLDLAHYMQEYFSNALKYLIKVKGLEQGRENYITHVRRGMLENIKEEGLSKAVDSMFTALQEDYAVFNIGTDQHILPLDKFFQYEMRRTGVIAPSENVIKVFLQYVNTFEKMVSLNEIMPVMDIYAQSITPQKYTPKGLEMDKSIKNFVH